ncbi:MAG TPA: YggT family protein [Gemmatimonadaceae bacterium]
MNVIDTMYLLGAFSRAVRVAVLVVAIAALVVAVAAWAVQARRISPFGRLARTIRRVTDPLLAPLEKRLVRSGRRVANAPWWLLGGVVVGGLLLIALVDFVIEQVLATMSAASAGPRAVLVLLVIWTFAVLRFALLVRVLSSWIPVSPLNPVIRVARRLTEWMLHPLRSVIPMVGMFDLTPLIAWFLLGIVQRVVVSLIA